MGDPAGLEVPIVRVKSVVLFDRSVRRIEIEGLNLSHTYFQKVLPDWMLISQGFVAYAVAATMQKVSCLR